MTSKPDQACDDADCIANGPIEHTEVIFRPLVVQGGTKSLRSGHIHRFKGPSPNGTAVHSIRTSRGCQMWLSGVLKNQKTLASPTGFEPVLPT